MLVRTPSHLVSSVSCFIHSFASCPFPWLIDSFIPHAYIPLCQLFNIFCLEVWAVVLILILILMIHAWCQNTTTPLSPLQLEKQQHEHSIQLVSKRSVRPWPFPAGYSHISPWPVNILYRWPVDHSKSPSTPEKLNLDIRSVNESRRPAI